MPAQLKLSPEVCAVLERVDVNDSAAGFLLRLPARQDLPLALQGRGTDSMLPRPLYDAVSKILAALGGKWNRKLGGHTFSEDPRPKLAEALGVTGSVTDKKVALQQFYTPAWLAAELVRRIDAVVGPILAPRVLEPSAGRGAIRDAVFARYPHASVCCVDVDPANVAALDLQAMTWLQQRVCADFMTLQEDASFDIVATNPPWTKGQDPAHVVRAFDFFLRPGGVLGAIVSPAALTSRFKRNRVFQDYHKRYSLYEAPVLPGTFKESGTMVGATIVVWKKPAHG